MIFASQGLKLPPLKRPDLTGQRASAEQIKGWAKAVNARMAARKRTKTASPPRPKRRPPKTAR